MSQFSRMIGHDQEGQPVMCIFRKRKPEAGMYAIPLRDAHLYSEMHNPNFEQHIMSVVRQVYTMMGIGDGLIVHRVTTARQMAELATVIEEGLDDLLKAPPRPPEPGKVIGSGRIAINDQTFDVEQTDTGKVNVYQQ